MKVAVRYFTRGGNSKKLADAVAADCGVEAKDTSVPLDEKVDALFLCSALYAGGVDASVKKFIEDNKSNIGTIYNISSSASPSSTYKKVKQIADENGVAVSENAFRCFGSFLFMHKGKPDEEDLRRVASFAKSVIGN